MNTSMGSMTVGPAVVSLAKDQDKCNEAVLEMNHCIKVNLLSTYSDFAGNTRKLRINTNRRPTVLHLFERCEL